MSRWFRDQYRWQDPSKRQPWLLLLLYVCEEVGWAWEVLAITASNESSSEVEIVLGGRPLLALCLPSSAPPRPSRSRAFWCFCSSSVCPRCHLCSCRRCVVRECAIECVAGPRTAARLSRFSLCFAHCWFEVSTGSSAQTSKRSAVQRGRQSTRAASSATHDTGVRDATITRHTLRTTVLRSTERRGSAVLTLPSSLLPCALLASLASCQSLSLFLSSSHHHGFFF